MSGSLTPLICSRLSNGKITLEPSDNLLNVTYPVSIDSSKVQPKLSSTLLYELDEGEKDENLAAVLSTIRLASPVILSANISLPATSDAFTVSSIAPSIVSSPALLRGITKVQTESLLPSVRG